MQRRIFIVKRNDQQIATKYAWNASLRLVEQDVKTQAKETLELVDTSSLKNAAGQHYRGFRIWRGATQVFNYEIVEQEPERAW